MYWQSRRLLFIITFYLLRIRDILDAFSQMRSMSVKHTMNELAVLKHPIHLPQSMSIPSNP